jgi:hypothetical protein
VPDRCLPSGRARCPTWPSASGRCTRSVGTTYVRSVHEEIPLDVTLITVHARQEHLDGLHGREPPLAIAAELVEALQTRGVDLIAVHPGQREPELANQFSVAVEPARVEEILDLLQSSAVVDGAYVKPAVELA